MCGQFGFVNVCDTQMRKSDLKDWFRQALIVDSLRGTHSTGVATLDNKLDTWQFIKEAMPGWNFVDWQPAKDVINKATQSSVMIGHNRLATTGKINTHTAHPYKYGDIIGFHNGTLHRSELPQWSQFEVDSMALINAIHEVGPREAFEKTRGAFATIWLDLANDTLNFIRNSERSLCFAWANHGQTLLFASEAGMLEWLAERNDIGLDDRVYSFAEGFHYQIDLNNVKAGLTKTEYNLQPVGTAFGFMGYASSGYNPSGYFNTTRRGTNLGKASGEEKEALKAVGKGLSDWVSFDPIDFRQYNGASENNLGLLSGVDMYGNTVLVHSVSGEYWQNNWWRVLKGKIVHAYFYGQEVRVVVDNSNLQIDWQAMNEEMDEGSYFGSETIRGPNGYVDPEKFDRLVKDGCANCGMELSRADAETIIWFSDDAPLCAECAPMFIYDEIPFD